MLQMVTFFFVLDLIKRMSKVKKFLRELDKHMDKAAKMVTPHPEYKAVLKCLMVLLVLSILAKALCRSRLGTAAGYAPVVRCGKQGCNLRPTRWRFDRKRVGSSSGVRSTGDSPSRAGRGRRRQKLGPVSFLNSHHTTIHNVNSLFTLSHYHIITVSQYHII